MSDQLRQIRIGGLGGQGLVTMGAVLAEAGALAGLHVAASQSYGSRARGGATRSDVILSVEPIDFPHIHQADLLLVLAQEAFDLYAQAVVDGGAVLYDPHFVQPQERAGLSLLAVPATSVAMEQLSNKLAANFVMLGALIGYASPVRLDEVQQAVAVHVRPRFQDLNLKALRLGLAVGRDLGEQGSA